MYQILVKILSEVRYSPKTAKKGQIWGKMLEIFTNIVMARVPDHPPLRVQVSSGEQKGRSHSCICTRVVPGGVCACAQAHGGEWLVLGQQLEPTWHLAGSGSQHFIQHSEVGF